MAVSGRLIKAIPSSVLVLDRNASKALVQKVPRLGGKKKKRQLCSLIVDVIQLI